MQIMTQAVEAENVFSFNASAETLQDGARVAPAGTTSSPVWAATGAHAATV
jgi:hypothetical protein